MTSALPSRPLPFHRPGVLAWTPVLCRPRSPTCGEGGSRSYARTRCQTLPRACAGQVPSRCARGLLAAHTPGSTSHPIALGSPLLLSASLVTCSR